MKFNIGSTDKTIRIIGGFGIFALGLLNESYWGAIGLIPVFTAFMGWCPLYSLIGFDSCPVKKINT